MQLSVFSGYVPWLDKMMVVFSDEQGYELDSLPGHSSEGLNLVKLFVVLS